MRKLKCLVRGQRGGYDYHCLTREHGFSGDCFTRTWGQGGFHYNGNEDDQTEAFLFVEEATSQNMVEYI